MTGHKVKLGRVYLFEKGEDGALRVIKRDGRTKLSASEKIRQRKSKRVRVSKRAPG